jgi:hypothetical protein
LNTIIARREVMAIKFLQRLEKDKLMRQESEKITEKSKKTQHLSDGMKRKWVKKGIEKEYKRKNIH